MKRLVHFLIPLLFACIACIAQYFEWFQAADLFIYDNAQRLSSAPSSDEIIIIAIDEQSIASIGRWPWPRSVHSKLLQNLNPIDYKAIVFDVLFSEPDTKNPLDDIALARSMSASARVILPMHMGTVSHKGQAVEVAPYTSFFNSAATIGHAHVDCASNGICRSVYLHEGVGAPNWPHLALALNDFLAPNSVNLPKPIATTNASPMLIYRENKRLINFPKYSNIPTVSYQSILDRSIDLNVFRHKVIFLGATSAGVGDILGTPIGRMPGVELNALIYQNIATDSFIHNSSTSALLLLSFGLVFVSLALISFGTPSQLLIGIAALSLSYLSLSVFLLSVFRIWLPCAATMIACISFYPVWSWLRLEMALRYLQRSLFHLQKKSKLSKEPQIIDGLSDYFSVRPINHFLSGADTVSNTIQELRFANIKAQNANNLVASSLSQLQEGVIIARLDGSILFFNSLCAEYFPTLNSTGHLNNLNQLLDLATNESWTKALNTFRDNAIELNIEAKVTASSSSPLAQAEELDLYIQLRKVQIDLIKSDQEQRETDIIIVSFTDVSALKQSERARMETLDFISHDLRSPMVSVLSLLNKFELNQEPDSATRELLESVRLYTNKNLQHSEALLSLSRAQAQKTEDFVLCDFHAIIDDAHASVLPQANAKNISIEVFRDNADLWLMALPDLLERTLVNLLTNAINYSESYTRITLKLQHLAQNEGNSIQLSISDQGRGISPELAPHLFSRFKRGDNVAQTSGSGLGLYFVRTVINLHKGLISFERNMNSSQGTTFRLTLPLSDLNQPQQRH